MKISMYINVERVKFIYIIRLFIGLVFYIFLIFKETIYWNFDILYDYPLLISNLDGVIYNYIIDSCSDDG